MGIFSSIKNAIFGRKDDETPATAQSGTFTPAGQPTTGPTATPSTAAAVSDVDVAAKLDAMPGAGNLNWRNSIVDLMKLLGLDPSMANRKELATELGRPNYAGSADDNLWLHRQTMQELARNGGKVPAEFLD